MGEPAIDLKSVPRLRELVAEAVQRGELVLTEGGEAVAKIVPLTPRSQPRRPGSARGLIHMADDFDVTPAEFEDYF